MNWGHKAFQASALPTELSRHVTSKYFPEKHAKPFFPLNHSQIKKWVGILQTLYFKPSCDYQSQPHFIRLGLLRALPFSRCSYLGIIYYIIFSRRNYAEHFFPLKLSAEKVSAKIILFNNLPLPFLPLNHSQIKKRVGSKTGSTCCKIFSKNHVKYHNQNNVKPLQKNSILLKSFLLVNRRYFLISPLFFFKYISKILKLKKFIDKTQ